MEFLFTTREGERVPAAAAAVAAEDILALPAHHTLLDLAVTHTTLAVTIRLDSNGHTTVVRVKATNDTMTFIIVMTALATSRAAKTSTGIQRPLDLNPKTAPF
tara:strand:- start:249 stop:557 length:309 start_codon:yes stop_codon:yes gene_type:complete